MKFTFWFVLFLCLTYTGSSQLLYQKNAYTQDDTLRGSITKYRQGWNVVHYNLDVEVNIEKRSISGKNKITFLQTAAIDTIQVDLQEPMVIDSIIIKNGTSLPFKKKGNAWLVKMNLPAIASDSHSMIVYYHGSPKQALNAPWDGGVVWSRDKEGNPFIATACQGLGASVWWPCKDHQSDEPETGMTISITAPSTLTAVSNGRLKNKMQATVGKTKWTWEVVNPINAYNVTMNIGKYVNWQDTMQGMGGMLDVSYWVLAENETKARKQFTQVKPVIHCFENWLGQYPFYEDGYKLIETPFLGMEHQSGIAYGNKYLNGYLGTDHLSGTGWGLKWDYIIVHESGHEWFGNSITTADLADMWIHEGFTTYTEVLYTECLSGKEAAYQYAAGLMKQLMNDKPLVAPYGVNEEGSGDMYKKGAAIIHTLRNMIGDDEKFRKLLLDMNSKYFKTIVTSKVVEHFLVQQTGLPLHTFFDQYLRTTNIPVLELATDVRNKKLYFRFANVTHGFSIPVRLNKNHSPLHASTEWKTVTLPNKKTGGVNPAFIQANYLVQVRMVQPPK